MDFEKIVDKYGNYKQQEKELKEVLTELNSTIKTEMQNNNETELKGSNYVCKYQTITQESFDENLLLKTIKQSDFKDIGLIKTKEYVDMEELEKAIYEGLIDVETIAKCKVTKTTTRLTVSKVKGEK